MLDRRTLKRWSDAAASVPRVAYAAMRFGVAPTGARVVSTLRKEGPKDLHWKVLGDALTEVFRSSGPVLTKLGQILAARDDLFPREVLLRFEALYSKQPAMSAERLEAALKQAYPKGLPFESFERKPLGVGSIGQVHRARLGGQPVIVKLIRPGIAREIERDMNAAHVLVDLLFVVPLPGNRASHLMLSRALNDLAKGFQRETDLRVEADALDEFRKRFRKNPRVCVPLCHRAQSGPHALVMEELKGEPLSAFRSRGGAGHREAKKVAELALKEILGQVFIEGRFHADPHAGNLLVLEDGRLGLIDLGLTGELTGDDRKHISRAVRAFVRKDPDALITALLGFGETTEGFDLKKFRHDVIEVVTRHKGKVKERIVGKTGGGESLDKFVSSLFEVARRHKVYVPSSATMLIKTLVTIEGVARSLDPEINLVTAALPVIMKSLTPSWLRWEFWAG